MGNSGNRLTKPWATGGLRRQEPQIAPQCCCHGADAGARASLRLLNDNAPDKTGIVCRGIVAERQQQSLQHVGPKFYCPLGESSMMPQPFQEFGGSRIHARTDGRWRERRYDTILRQEESESAHPAYVFFETR